VSLQQEEPVGLLEFCFWNIQEIRGSRGQGSGNAAKQKREPVRAMNGPNACGSTCLESQPLEIAAIPRGLLTMPRFAMQKGSALGVFGLCHATAPEQWAYLATIIYYRTRAPGVSRLRAFVLFLSLPSGQVWGVETCLWRSSDSVHSLFKSLSLIHALTYAYFYSNRPCGRSGQGGICCLQCSAQDRRLLPLVEQHQQPGIVDQR
jgi:hypothetical protein